MSPSQSARSLGRLHQRKAGEQVKFDVYRRTDDITVVADDTIVIEEDDIMIDHAIHEILNGDEKPINE